MNYTFLNGKIAAIPKISIIPMNEKKQVYVCKFVIGTYEGSGADGHDSYNFFECIAFNDTAMQINEKFSKGAKVAAFGKLVNHIYKDGNNTLHFTNIVLVEHIEYGDVLQISGPGISKKARLPLDAPVISDLNAMDILFTEICESGFLCIDEDDYYSLAIGTMEMP